MILASIMVAGGVTFAIPGAMPEAAAQSSNANLYVSAENAMFDNVFTGLNVIEVVVRDPSINDRGGPDDTPSAEPRVEVDGDQLRMVQGSDGNWYGYFAEINIGEIDDDESSDVAINYGTKDNVTTRSDINEGMLEIEAEYTMVAASGDHPVIRTSKAINKVDSTAERSNDGSIGLTNANQWPFIQVYDFDDESDIVVEYQKGGDAQSVTLYYDSDPDEYGTGLELGRDRYPLGGGVIMTMTDLAMNVDPTDSDTWTFVIADSDEAYYYLFDDNGMCTDRNPLAIDRTVEGAVEGIDDNLYLTIDPDRDGSTVLDFQVPHKGSQECGKEGNERTLSRGASYIDNNINIVTFIEGDPGVFMNTDSNADVPNIIVPYTAARGNTAVIDYNDGDMSIVVGNVFATIEIDGDAVGGVWNSGEEVPVTLTDPDVNRKALNDEDIDVSDPDFTIIPSVRIGSPITLAGTDSVTVGVNTTLTLADREEAQPGNFTVDAFSDIVRLMPAADITNGMIKFDGVTTGEDLKSFLTDRTNNPAVFQYLNIDVRSIGKITSATFQWQNASGSLISTPLSIAGSQDMFPIAMDVVMNVNMIPDDSAVDIVLDFGEPIKAMDNNGDYITYPVVVDLFSFGQKGDGVAPGDRINNAIYRLELEESGDNTGVFEGTMEYVMLNQLNVRVSDTYEGIDPISDGIVMIVHNDMTDEDSIRINYLDLGADGVSTQVADQIEAPTTSGSVSFDSNNYKVADTVTVTLEDADLNTAVDTIDIYTVVNAVYNSTGHKATPKQVESEWMNKNGIMSPDGYRLMIQNELVFFRDDAYDQIGKEAYGRNTAGENFGRVLDITFDDKLWLNGCGIGGDNGLGSTGFTLIETGSDTGVFTGDFQVPLQYCHRDGGLVEARSTTGVDMEVNYVDYRDSSGETIEVGDSAGIKANTGSVSLDRSVYPVPFGQPDDFKVDRGNNQIAYLDTMTIVPIHKTGVNNNQDPSKRGIVVAPGNFIEGGDLMVHIRINDPDFDISASGEDKIMTTVERNGVSTHGPLKVTISRGSDAVILATAGAPSEIAGRITKLGPTQFFDPVGDGSFTSRNEVVNDVTADTRELGPITEIAPDAGIFELDLAIRYSDGPASSECPTSSSFVPLNGDARIFTNNQLSAEDRFTDRDVNHCILQGDIITVEYTDPTDASGNENTVTDSATFDLRNGVLQSDKSVYIIGGDMILTLIEPDLNLESDEAETYDLDLIEWDSDAAAVTMGNAVGYAANFDPEPSDLRETGDSTGIFQVVVEIPEELAGDRIERGEAIELEYTDYGPSGADYVGDDTEDINLNIFTSNFGATIELDQKVYTWTDKVYITIVAPDHNFDSDLVDEIGETEDDPIRISTRSAELEQYRLVETGTDTGIFAGEVILTGFAHDADGNPATGNDFGADVLNTKASGSGPNDGNLPTGDDDGITVSFEFSEDETVLGTALVRWNIGEVQWIETSYPAQGTGIVRVIDPDMNLDPESVDNFDVDVYSDSDSGGIDLTVTETNEATGVFEGTVFFTTTDESSGHRLRVSEGDTITTEYTDGTLPNPYSTNDDIDITATSIIGTIVPPLERAPVSNARVVDSFGNSLTSVSVDQQVQITADVINGQDRTQSFAYLVQIQDANGVTVSLSWIEGSLNPGQSLSPAQSWTPDAPGAYTATVFVWESVDNPTALSPPGTVNVNVR